MNTSKSIPMDKPPLAGVDTGSARAVAVTAAADRDEQLARSANWNLVVLATHHVMLRLAWIFKTETVLMPAFLDVIAGAGWIRGCLPILNRIGQSVPPLLSSAALRNSSFKVRWLFATTLTMSFLFGILTLLCLSLGNGPVPWFPAVFLVLYAGFFAVTGINQMSFNTLQGKLIPAARRGRLMSLAGMAGSAVAMTAAYLLLTPWLAMPDGTGFVRIFGTTAAIFAISAVMLFFVREPGDEKGHSESHPVRLLGNAWRTFINTPALRRLGIVTMLFMTSMLLFPHYQWLGRTVLNAKGADLMWWVLVQNGAVGLFSWLAGSCGDRFGYRIVVRWEIFASATIPLIAIGLSAVLDEHSRGWYMITFAMLGLIPVTIKSFYNYVLELADESQHPHYLSTLSLCMAIPLFLAPLAGWLVDWNAPLVFVTIAILVGTAGILTFRMDEPRHQTDPASH